MKHALYELLQELDEKRFFYTLNRLREDTVHICVSFVGERVEIDVFSDGHMEVSRFLGTEDVLGGKELVSDLINKNVLANKFYEKNKDEKKDSR